MITCPSPAKLNLFLYITSRRPDGYHDIQTLFQFLDYGDILYITPRSHGDVHLLTPIPGITNEDNLIVRAARLLMQTAKKFGTLTSSRVGADITIDKRLPLGGGLGGGSSNAATVLLALNYLWNTRLENEVLCALSLQLGADIPVFIRGQSAFAEGIGEVLKPISLPEKWYLVVHPGVSISTQQIFNDPDLIRNSPIRSFNELLQTPFRNACEAVVRKRFCEVDMLITWLLKYAPSRLTGTGACVFAEFSTKHAAHNILEKIPKWTHGFIAQGINLSPLHMALSGQLTKCNSIKSIL